MTQSLVTGADGFVGQHLVADLLARGDDVVGAVKELPPRLTTLSEVEANQVRWRVLDLEKRDTIRDTLQQERVDRVFHLAAASSVAESLVDTVLPLRLNVIGTRYLLDELAALRREAGYDPQILISGSAEAYGAAALRFRPLTEDCPLEPLSPYGVSKAAQEMLGLQAYRSSSLSVIVTRSFNHIGPGQRSSFVAPQLAAQVRALSQTGKRGSVRVGDVSVRRDFTDVRDVARAYISLSERGEAGRVYNVCSNRTYSIQELLDTLADIAGVEVEVKPEPGRFRPADIRELVGSFQRLAEATGWRPEIELRHSLADLLRGPSVD